MLSVLATKQNKQTRTPMRQKEALGVVGYVCYLDCGEAIMGIRYVQAHLTVNIKKYSSLCINYSSIKLFFNTVHLLFERERRLSPRIHCRRRCKLTCVPEIGPWPHVKALLSGALLPLAKLACAMHSGRYGLSRDFFIISKLRKFTLI